MKAMTAAIAVGVLTLACGSAGAKQEAPTPSQQSVFVFCPGATPAYLLVDAPRNDCRTLVAGKDYADGRVLIGVKAGTSDADLQTALAAYHATEVAVQPAAGQRVLQVPKGTVPEAVVGLARYAFITFAQPDLLQQPDQSVT